MFSGQAEPLDLLEAARQQGHNVTLLAKPFTLLSFFGGSEI
jgi:hypothetical protein